MPTTTYAQSRLLPLDTMRGSAAMLVAIGHFRGTGAIDIGDTFALCVPFFLILSGYVLSYAYGINIGNSHMSLSRFAIVRLARLYPLHIVTFAAVLSFWLSIDIARSIVSLPISNVVGLNASPVNWVETLTLTHFLFGGGVSFNTPSWSISVEWWCGFYLFALWATGSPFMRGALVAAGLAAMAFILWSGGFLGSNQGAATKSYGIGLGCFAIGFLLHRGAHRLEPLVRKVPAAMWWAFAALVAMAIVAPPVNLAEFKHAEAGYYLAFALLIAGLAHTRVTIGAGTIEKAGDWSYGIYLWHVPLALALRALAVIAEKASGAAILNTPILDAIYIPSLILVSAMSYRYIEVPAKLWMRGLSIRAGFQS